MGMGLKTCVKCLAVLPMDSFHRNSRAADGHFYRCKPCEAVRSREKYLADPERAKARMRARQAKGLAKRKPRTAASLERRREANRRMDKKRSSDPRYLVNRRVAKAMRKCLNGKKGEKFWTRLVGYEYDDLKQHLERQFTKGMGWENMSEWHIDHIVPLASFGISGPDDPNLRSAWALTNLRPCWAKENVRKGAKRVFLL